MRRSGKCGFPEQLERSERGDLKSVDAVTAGALGKQITRTVVRGRQCAKKRVRPQGPNLQAAADWQTAKARQRSGLFPAARLLDGPDGSMDNWRRSPTHGG